MWNMALCPDNYCSETFGIFPLDYSYGGYLVLNLPNVATHKDEMKLIFQTKSYHDNPIARFELDDNRYYEIKMVR